MSKTNKPKCGRLLRVESYGGGTRYHCPHCDVKHNEYHIPMAQWSNATPPQDRRCTRPA